MIKIVIDIFMYFFEFILFWHYSDTLFDAKKNKSTRTITMLLNTVFLGIIYQFNITYLNVILMFITYILLLLYLYNVTFKTALFHSLIFMAVMLTSELLIMAISSILYDDFNALENNISVYLFAAISSKLIYFGIMMAILKLFAQKENNEKPNKYFWLLFVMPLANIFVLLCFRYITYQMKLNQTLSVLWMISCIGILFANILVFVIYEFSLKNTKELYELKEAQHQEEQDKRYFEIIEQTNKEMRVFSHDIKNHLMQIRNLDNTEAIYEYVDKLYPDIEKFSNIGVSKNKMLDLIISKYTTLCESKGIEFDVDVKTANLSYIDDVDLSTLINNLLDNAIEAAEKSENGFIQINIFSKNTVYDGVLIKNSSSFSPETIKGELKTTKLNKNIHGIGTKSIKRIVKKYNALYDWKYDEAQKIFETELAFSKKE